MKFVNGVLNYGHDETIDSNLTPHCLNEIEANVSIKRTRIDQQRRCYIYVY